MKLKLHNITRETNDPVKIEYLKSLGYRPVEKGKKPAGKPAEEDVKPAGHEQ